MIGDVIKVKIIQRKKSFALGTLELIEKPSIDRVEYKLDSEALGGGVPMIGYTY